MKTFNKTIGPEIVVDTGIIIEYFEGTDRGKKIKTFIFENEFINSILATPLLVIEIYYILRRKNSINFVREVIQEVQHFLTIVPMNEYYSYCGEIKAEHPFALSDCCTLGLAEYKNIRALFVHEREIDDQLQEVGSNQCTQRIIFIEDFEIFNDEKS